MSNQVVVVSTKLLHFLAVISGQAMHHLLPVDAKTDIEGYLHVARLRRPPPKPQRARACSAAEPPSHIQPQKPKISKVRLRRASHERHEKNTVPLTAALWGQRTPCDHRAGHAATDTLTLGARPSAAARPTTDDDTRVHRCTEEYHALYDSRTHTTNQHVDQAMGVTLASSVSQNSCSACCRQGGGKNRTAHGSRAKFTDTRQTTQTDSVCHTCHCQI